MTFPNDADGDALRAIAERSDMSQPMDIDFAVDVPDEASGQGIARLAVSHGYTTVVEHDDEADCWTCYCTKRMVPAYDAVVAAQRELDELSATFGGHSDGWGTHGNQG